MSAMALSLGIKHGFDLDHLATIDAISRVVRRNYFLSKITGILFSLGHGIVVILFSLIIGSGLMQSHIPEWLDGFGKMVSISFLILFGLLNLYSIWHSHPQQVIPISWQNYIVKKLNSKMYSPLTIVAIGALFALSFDTVSQVALFSLSASLLAGWLFSGILGLFFMLGMMISDGVNGLLVSILIQRVDGSTFAIISRGLGLSISLFSLALGVIGLFDILQE